MSGFCTHSLLKRVIGKKSNARADMDTNECRLNRSISLVFTCAKTRKWRETTQVRSLRGQRRTVKRELLRLRI